MEIDSFKQFEKFLASHVPPKEAVFKNDAGIKRMGYFMKLLGNPQNKIKVIHIAGTSGKGSTAYLTGHILWSQGFRVGLSVSPHILDIRERMQIFDLPRKSKPQARAKNTRCASNLPSKKLILKYFSEIQPTIKVMGKSKYGPPTFFEICIIRN
mgnify:FL=1